MQASRRNFVAITSLALLDIACGRDGGTDSPVSPSPAAPPNQAQYPTAACWGTRIGVYTVPTPGTLGDVMSSTGKSPVFVYNALERGLQLTSFDGNTPSLGLLVLVRGQWYRGNIAGVTVNPGDTYAVYRASGRNFTGNANGVDTCN